MPEIQRNDIYNAIYEVASQKFANPENLEPYLITKTTGTPLYRYVSYRTSMPQGEASPRTIWGNLANDTRNRWTGQGTQVGQGRQGLYLSGEYLDIPTPFPELDHYLDRNTDPNAEVNYFRYQQGRDPELRTARVSELRSMFLFSLTDEVQGIDLSLNGEGEHPLLEEILAEARQNYPQAFAEFAEEDMLQTLYYNGEDASFCRAIGNAVLEQTNLRFFQTTSVRDRQSSNVILRPDEVQQGRQISNMLRSEGRSTFFLKPEINEQPAQVEGVFTIADLLYNTQFEPVDVEVIGLPSKAELNLKLTEISTQIVDNLVQTYEQSLNELPPTELTEATGRRIEAVRQCFANNQIEEALDEITELKRIMTQAITENRQNFQENEVRAYEVVNSVMGSLSDITTVIDRTNRELENPNVEPPDGEGIEVEDPPVEDVDPVINEPVGEPPALV